MWLSVPTSPTASSALRRFDQEETVRAPVITPEERRAEIARRQVHIRRRWRP